MKPTERARRNKEVSVGFTSFGGTVKKIWMFFCQGPMCNEIITNRPLSEKNRKRLLRKYVFHKGKRISVRRRPEYAFVCGGRIHRNMPPLVHVSVGAGSMLGR